ncbi:hypothetical protein [Paenibacillus sp. UMB7766-LJ446]|uniref:hypothetical protein n=1 Tax=Paenibacillus sp. UMB7766-LJ446 TaxID=3046313 RepID=UPI00254A1109|nr:hypothetical protein [Paenibacillus sp. UMB7766-LJ446]
MGRQYRHELVPGAIPNHEKIEIEQVDAVDKKPNAHLDRVYRALTKELCISVAHEIHLREARNMSDDTIRVREYRTMPESERWTIAKEVGKRLSSDSDLLGVPGFFVQEGKYGPYWTMSGYSGLMVPFRSIQNEITGWQIRVDSPPLELDLKGAVKGTIRQEIEKDHLGNRRALCALTVGGKELEVQLTVKDKKVCMKDEQFIFSVELKQSQRYWWWSSGSKTNGASIGGPIPYHLALPSPCLRYWNSDNDAASLIDCSEVWVTEGALKADKAADGLLKPVFGLPGVGSYPLILEPLKELGCKHVVIAFDADSVKTPEVQRALELCAEFFAANTDMKLSLAMWDISLGKGIDDLLDQGYIPQVSLLVE